MLHINKPHFSFSWPKLIVNKALIFKMSFIMGPYVNMVILYLGVCGMLCLGRSEDNLGRVGSFLPQCGFQELGSAQQLSSKCRYPLSQFISANCDSFKDGPNTRRGGTYLLVLVLGR